jgi:hypothetical protein
MMKKFLSLAAIAVIGVVFSCQTDDELTSENAVSNDALAKIAALGFSTQNVQRIDDAYLVEGDIILHDQDLNGTADRRELRIAEVEQYHTYNLVKGLPRVISVSMSSDAPAGLSAALDHAIARYNAQNLNISMQRVSSGGDINVRLVNTGQYIASAGFPTSQGDPYGEVKYAKRYSTGYSDGFMTTVLAHEMGHCIGFRHTDYMNRSYSCGGTGGNEGSGSVGAVHIPGTPTDPDRASWMLACLSATTDRPFNANDKTALSYLY